MRLVPRQMRRSDFPSSVPYYGGRLTPQVIAGMKPSPARPGDDGARTQLLAALQVLSSHGVLTEREQADIGRRIIDRP